MDSLDLILKDLEGLNFVAAEEPGQLAKFTVFPKLPLELRRKIWSSVVGPRTVYVNYDSEWPTPGSKPFDHEIRQLMSVSAESREEMLHHYISIRKISALWLPHEQLDTYCFVDPKIDTVVIHGEMAMHPQFSSRMQRWVDHSNARIRGGLGRIQNLRIHSIPFANLTSITFHGEEMYRKYILYFPALKKLELRGFHKGPAIPSRHISEWDDGVEEARLREVEKTWANFLSANRAIIPQITASNFDNGEAADIELDGLEEEPSEELWKEIFLL